MFSLFAHNLHFLKNPTTNFQKKSSRRRSAYIFVCLHTILVSFRLHLCLQPAKIWGDLWRSFYPICFENLPTKSEIFVSMNRFEKLPPQAATPIFFYIFNYGPRNSQIFNFLTVLLQFFEFS